jgi:hypothetical protein
VRFELQLPTGPPREVALEGTLAVIGRDPSCDLVLPDPKCSRRHAVLEAGPSGISVRDSGSANGLFVNGKRVERASLSVGDVVKVGDARLTVLAEDVPGTLVMESQELEPFVATSPMPLPMEVTARAIAAPDDPTPQGADLTPVLDPTPVVGSPAAEVPSPPPPAPPPPPLRVAPPRPAPVAVRPPPRPVVAPGRTRLERPAAVATLAILWALSAPAMLTAGLLGGRALDWQPLALVPILAAAMGAAIAMVASYGMWGRAPWARLLQIGLGAVGLFTCTFSLTAATAIVYMLRPAARAHFAPPGLVSPEDLAAAHDDRGDVAFAVALAGTMVIGIVVTSAMVLVLRHLSGSVPSFAP